MNAAKRGFSALAADPSYEPVVPFYLLQIEFQQGNYPYVIEHGIPLLAKSTESRQREISRIVSEAYFHQGDYPRALAYMDNYEKLGGTMGREELYLAGYCYYADRGVRPGGRAFGRRSPRGATRWPRMPAFIWPTAICRRATARRR